MPQINDNRSSQLASEPNNGSIRNSTDAYHKDMKSKKKRKTYLRDLTENDLSLERQAEEGRKLLKF